MIADKVVRDILAIDTNQDQWDCRKQQIEIINEFVEHQNKELKEALRQLYHSYCNDVARSRIDMNIIDSTEQILKTEK